MQRLEKYKIGNVGSNGEAFCLPVYMTMFVHSSKTASCLLKRLAQAETNLLRAKGTTYLQGRKVRGTFGALSKARKFARMHTCARKQIRITMNRRKLAQDLTLMLLYLNSWEEKSGSISYRRAWKGYEFDDLDLLEDLGYLSGSHKAKSVYLYPEGMEAAEKLFELYGIELDPIPDKQPFFRLVLTFRFEELSCSRTLLVPKHTTFLDFHTMIQACFNWLNYHLFNFTLTFGGEELYISMPDPDTGDDPRLEYAFRGETFTGWRDVHLVCLDDYLPKTKKMLYSYDYGDGWEIEIELRNASEKIASDVPICWDGAGDAPPEDVGGEGGFIYFLDVISDPENEDHEHMSAWGEGQGFERFSLPLTNDRLARWSDWGYVDDETAPDYGGSDMPSTTAGNGNVPSQAEAMLFLLRYEGSLRASGLSEKTVQQHMDNTAYFFLTYLIEKQCAPFEGCVEYIDEFMGFFFIYECDWSSEKTLKGMATSLKKFYKYLYLAGHIDKGQFQEAQSAIKAGLPVWLDTLKKRDAAGAQPRQGLRLV